MTRVLILTLAIVAISAIGSAGQQGATSASGRLRSTTGVVKAVSSSLLTLVRGDNEMTFAVDSSTRFVARGGARDLLRRMPEPPPVKAGDEVTVKFRQRGDSRNAVEVRRVYR